MSHQDDVREQNHKDLQNLVIAECEYPGQTLMVALAITLEFSSLGEAKKLNESKDPFGAKCTSAASSQMVPGAGCAVYTALDALEEGVRNNLSSDDMVMKLREVWYDYVQNTSFEDRFKIGMAKAFSFEHFFRHHWGIWRNISIEEQKLEDVSAL